MLNAKSFLAVDFGAGTLKLAEFEINEVGGLRLVNYGVRSLGSEGAQESAREPVVLKALQEVIAEKGIRTKVINVCAPGFHVFSKFVKLPPVDTGKVGQIIEYEARQNVPFPLEEVVWDYQITGNTGGGELEVLLVAIKKDIVEGLFRVAEQGGTRLQLVDVSPAALCNSFRYNYGDLEAEGCSMLLDIGAKTSNLLFFEKGKFYSRSINIGANSITQDFANEAKLRFDEAEAAKIEKGFVSLGGAYEEPDDVQAAAISKIARQVMTKLHIQVNQTIQFYRGQQGGSQPVRLFLSGGASAMAYTADFFAEKLTVPVEYFNPFRNVQIDPSINVEELAKVAHAYGEVVGLGLRNLAHCPVELNLMPKTSIQRQQFQQKKPFFVASAFALAAVAFAVGWFFSKSVSIQRNTLDELKAKVAPLMQKQQEMEAASRDLQKVKKETEKIVGILESRYFWPEILMELRRVLDATEGKAKQKINHDVGLWIESFSPVVPGSMMSGAPPAPVAGGYERGGYVAPGEEGGKGGGYVAPGETPAGQPPQAAPGSENEISVISILCRGVDLENISPTANSDLAYALKSELETSPYFVKESIELAPIQKAQPSGDQARPLFSFGLTLKLKKPFKVDYASDK